MGAWAGKSVYPFPHLGEYHPDIGWFGKRPLVPEPSTRWRLTEMSDYLGLKGKRALVTGGTKGIGKAVAATLREAGATVLTTARSRPEDLAHADHFVTADVSTAERLRRRR
jgi:NADPH:quinone reductase-like Zn-dependent oxidoreductase